MEEVGRQRGVLQGREVMAASFNFDSPNSDRLGEPPVWAVAPTAQSQSSGLSQGRFTTSSRH